jgi:hypothetical protein
MFRTLLLVGVLVTAARAVNAMEAPILAPPLTTVDNPYLTAVVEGFQAEAARDATAQATDTDAAQRGSSRDQVDRLRAALWLLVNPASPLRGQTAVRTTLARWLSITLGEWQQAGDNLRHPAFDAFALATSIPTLVDLRRTVPDLAGDDIERDLARVADLLWAAHRETPSRWYNVDLALAVALTALGQHLQRPELTAKARTWAEGAVQHLYADGAFAYHGSQNECTHYHDADCLYLSRLFLLTKDPWYQTVLVRTAWYGPVTSSHGSEFWTVPSWKTGWAGTGDAYGTEAVVALADLPVLTGMRDRDLAQRRASGALARHWARALDGLLWYRRDLQPGQPLPDRYTAPDRNSDGPRAWYGRFSYAASLRRIATDEPGLPTLMGVQMLTPAGTRGQFTRSIAPRVRLEDAPDTGNGPWNARALASAWLTHDLRPAQVMGRTWSVIAGTYALHRPASSRLGPVTAWRGRQVWIGLPDRVVGVVDVAGPAGAPGLGLETVVALGSTTPTRLEDQGGGRYRYGDLAVRIHAADLPRCTIAEIPFRNWKHPVTDLRFQEDLPGEEPAALRRRIVVELRPADAPDDAQVMVEDVDLATVHLRVAQGPRIIDAWHRDAPGEAAITPTPGSHRMQAGQPAVPAAPLTIGQNQVVVTVSSPEATDLQPGWSSLAEMLATP